MLTRLKTLSRATPLSHRSISTSTNHQHWLDRFDKLQTWLDTATRRWWLRALLREQTKLHPELNGQTTLIRKALDQEYNRILDDHRHIIVDSRSATHLQIAALALATHKVLLPFIRDETVVMDILNQQMGSKTAPALQFLLKATSWIQPGDAFQNTRRRLRALQLDMGLGFDTELVDDDGSHDNSNCCTLTVTRCLYHSVFNQEEKPQLLQVTCCSQDRWVMDSSHKAGIIEAGLVSSMANGDSVCCYRVCKVVP